MTGFFGSGLAFALILAGMVLELAILLTLPQSFRTRHSAPASWLATSAPACAFSLPPSRPLRGAAWPAIAGALLLALAAHVFDLVQRWKR